jgi:hypothetical protein
MLFGSAARSDVGTRDRVAGEAVIEATAADFTAVGQAESVLEALQADEGSSRGRSGGERVVRG